MKNKAKSTFVGGKRIGKKEKREKPIAIIVLVCKRRKNSHLS